MNFLIFSFRGEVAQGAQFALPQVVVQVRLHKSLFSCSHFLVFLDFCCLVHCFYLLFNNPKRRIKQNNSKCSQILSRS